jgi:hypothetical protein
MSLKISEYTTEQTTIEDTDRQELSTEIAPSTWETRWYSITSLKAKLKAYFDTLYLTAVPDLEQVTAAGNSTTSGIDVASVNIISGTEQVSLNSSGQIDVTPDTTTPANKTTIQFTPPTASNNITFKDESGTVAFLSDIPSGGGSIPHATASGTDTYTATISGVTSYNDGDAYLIRFPNGNTTGATLNIYNGTSYLGAVDLYRNNDGPLIGGDIIAGGEMLCIYNSTTNAFQLIGTAPNTLLAYVTNADSVSITKGQVVYAFGGQGDRMTVKRANNSSEATSSRTVGVVLSTSIAANQKGIIIIQGLLDGLSILPTSTFADGDSLYLGSTAGSITNVKPTAPNNLVYLGVVTTANNGSSGRWYVKVQNGYELNELHDVLITSVADNQVLQYDSATSLWKNETLTPSSVGLDALLPILAENCTDGANTSGTTNTYSSGVLITPSMINADTTIEVLAGFRKSAANGAVTIRIYANTTNDIAGSPILIGQALYAAGVLYSAQSRQLRIKVKAGTGAGTEVLSTSINSVFSDLSNMTLAASNIAIDWTSNKYIVVSLQCGSSSDTARSTFIKVRR